MLLMLAVGTSFLVESLEMGAVSPLHSALGHAYGLSRAQRVGLAAMTYGGSMGGMLISGPLGDCKGRKAALMLANGLICLSSCLHAVVPLTSPTWVLLLLRLLGGLGGAISVPTGYTLAAESTPEELRLQMIFCISFVGNLGYILEALGIQWFMPHFGEQDSDNWRGLCLFIGLPAFAAMPLVWLVSESPSFLASNGRWDECAAALSTIASWNGRPESHAQALEEIKARRKPVAYSAGHWPAWTSLATHYLPVMVVLMLMDASKSFFTSGSAYLCKDLFELTRKHQSLSPTSLNIIASAAPLVGLLIGERFAWAGVRKLMLGWSLIAAASLGVLAIATLRSMAWFLLLTVILFKLAYGPMGTCLAMMKVQAFPTEFRASAFAMICVAGRLVCALGPMLLEALKTQEKARSWNPQHLSVYVVSLAAAALLSGLLVFPIPRACSSIPKLRSLSDINLNCSDDDDVVHSPLGRSAKYGSMRSGRGTRDIIAKSP